MTVFRWLHLSDLHWGSREHDDDWSTVEQKLIQDIDLVMKKMGGDIWDAIFFTGDLAARAKLDEFNLK